MKKGSGKIWISLAVPFLVFIGILGISLRKNAERMRAIPALMTGIAVISANILARKNRRENLLKFLEKNKNDLI